MLVQPFERPTEPALPPFLQETNPFEGRFGPQASAAGGNTTDVVSRFLPPGFAGDPGAGNGIGGLLGGLSGTSLFGEIGELLQSLGAMLQQLMGGTGFGGGGNGCQRYFGSATGSSTGDPHLSFDGNHWSNMTSQPNLLDSNSFPGGYHISTQVTQPNQNGVTYNDSATIASGYGTTNVTLDKSGNVSILQQGMQIPIAAGQTIDLGGGQTVTRTQNGLQMVAANGAGGQIATTLTANGTGVDVQTSANNVDLGGALVYGNQPVAQPFG